MIVWAVMGGTAYEDRSPRSASGDALFAPDDAADVGDAHGEDEAQQKDETDRVDGGLDLRRQPASEDPADEDEEQPPAVERRERDDVQHREVDGEHAHEPEQRGESELAHLRGHPVDLDRPADLRR